MESEVEAVSESEHVSVDESEHEAATPRALADYAHGHASLHSHICLAGFVRAAVLSRLDGGTAWVPTRGAVGPV